MKNSTALKSESVATTAPDDVLPSAKDVMRQVAEIRSEEGCRLSAQRKGRAGGEKGSSRRAQQTLRIVRGCEEKTGSGRHHLSLRDQRHRSNAHGPRLRTRTCRSEAGSRRCDNSSGWSHPTNCTLPFLRSCSAKEKRLFEGVDLGITLSWR